MPFGFHDGAAACEALGLERTRRRAVRRRRKSALLPLLLVPALLCAAVCLGARLRAISTSNALAEARDAVMFRTGQTVRRLLGGDGYESFVTLEKDAAGNVTALTTDTARVSRLAAALAQSLTEDAENGQLDLRVPLGDLLGAAVLLGRGPEIPVRIGLRSTTELRFVHGFSAAGLNQSRHTLSLEAEIHIDMLVPWGSAGDTVRMELPLAETVIVGRVPESYISYPPPVSGK